MSIVIALESERRSLNILSSSSLKQPIYDAKYKQKLILTCLIQANVIQHIYTQYLQCIFIHIGSIQMLNLI